MNDEGTKRTGKIHFAKFEESPRLQGFLNYMLHGEPRTGLEIIHGASITAVSAAADELRENGFHMDCIKKNNPPTYQLFNVDHARVLADNLLNGKKGGVKWA
jgi:hypothetical protein